MEGQITLSSCEILHVVGSLGKDDFFGIDDGYDGMDDMEISAAVAKAENSLIEKGYAQLDFNGNFSVAKEICDILLICADCDKMLDIEIFGADRTKIKKTVYAKGDVLVSFEAVGNLIYIITYATLVEIRNLIFDNFNWIKESGTFCGKASLSQKVLADAKQTLGFGTEEYLLKECKSTEIAKIIAGALNGGTNYYSFTFFDFEKESIETESLMVLNSDNGSLEVKTDGDEEISCYAFSAVDYKTVKKRIETTLMKL